MLGPTVTGTADISTLSNLLAIVADPDKAKQMLVDIAKQSAEAQQAAAQAQAAMDEAARAQAELVALKAEFHQSQMSQLEELADREAALDARVRGLKLRETAVTDFHNQQSDRSAALDKRQSDLDVRESVLNERMAGLDERAAQVAERESALTIAQLRATEAQKQYTDKLAQLKQIVG